MRTKHLIIVLIILALTLPASPALAGGVVSVCDEAHLLAALAGGGTVTFACSDTITLTAEIVIAADTIIDGTGQDVTISGNHIVRVFTVNAGVTLDLAELTVAYGYADTDGGGINSRGTVSVTRCTFIGNSANHDGGVIYNFFGILTVSNSMFSSNSTDEGLGGAINNSFGTVTIIGSTFSDNSATGGGAIYIHNGAAAISDNVFSGNSAYSHYQFGGGGIRNDGGTVRVSSSSFLDNSADSAGGGIYNYYGVLLVSNSTLSENSATGVGGGICNNGVMTVSNSTFSSNIADHGGGGILNSGTLVVSNSTLSRNGGPSGGDIYNDSYDTLVLNNTIVANSTTGSNCFGSMTDGGGNLSYPDATCPGIVADPMLGVLQDNGGPTWTMALGWGSAAIDAGNDAICAADPINGLDQRGVVRPQGAHCDIGAVEQILDPTAVSLDAFGAGSVPSAIPPILVFGLLVLALLVFGASHRGRQTHWK